MNLFITCLHLDHRTEPRRIREFKEIYRKSIEIRQNTSHILAGDFNALTKTDYEMEDWNEICKIRDLNSWEKPKIELTNMIGKLGYFDTWTLAGKPKPIKTCRFDTHIDYVFANAMFLANYKVASVLHLDDPASDHNMVITTFEEKRK